MKLKPTFTVTHLSADNPPPDGSVLFTENGLPRILDRLLERVTGSPLSHTMIFLRHDGRPYVYEAYPPKVRKITWRKFVEETLPEREARFWTRRLGGLRMVVWSPREPFAHNTLVAMHGEAEDGLGVNYSMIWNWLRTECEALHCSEYVGNICEAGGLLISDGGKETPGSLFGKLLNSGL